MSCPLCEREIVPSGRDYQLVVGWARKRDQGGTNAIRLRDDKAIFAHELCVDRAAKGINPSQGSFL